MTGRLDTAEFVKATRTRLKLTQRQFAAVIGMERRSIVRYEQGGDLPLAVLLALKFLNIEHHRKRQRQKRKLRREEQVTE